MSSESEDVEIEKHRKRESQLKAKIEQIIYKLKRN